MRKAVSDEWVYSLGHWAGNQEGQGLMNRTIQCVYTVIVAAYSVWGAPMTLAGVSGSQLFLESRVVPEVAVDSVYPRIQEQEGIERYSPWLGDTGYLLLISTAVLGGFYFAPEDVSQWSEEDKDLSSNALATKYVENVEEGPVWDTDDVWINWIAHPYCGAAYYVHSRHSGFTRTESFVYSALMSTFFWEYGIESVFEEPSIQDLISTPLGGLLFGELFLSVEEALASNNNKILGSRALGGVCQFLIDPIGITITPIRYLNRRWLRLTTDVEYFALPDSYLGVAGEDPVVYGFRVVVHRE